MEEQVFKRYRSRCQRMKDAAAQCGVEYSTLYRALNWMNRTGRKSSRAPSPRLEAAILEHCPDLLKRKRGER